MAEARTATEAGDGGLKAVFFDVEGTLWDGDGCARQVLEIVLPRFKDSLPVDDMDEVIRRFNAVFFDQVRAEHLRDRRPFSRLVRFEALLDSYGVKKRGLAREISHKCDATRRLIMRQFLRGGALALLADLGRRGLLRGAIVNGTPAVQRHLINSIGLEQHLDLVVLAEIEGYSKPDARIFKRSLELAGVEAGQTLYVGDSPLTDLLGASRAGIPTVWFNDGRRRVPKGFPAPDFTISTLDELPSVIEM
jgi:putative hydrolase of the HAD superfamily